MVGFARLRTALSAVSLPWAADGRPAPAVDVKCPPRPEVPTSPHPILCHTYGRGKDQQLMIPGWPYSEICALETGRRSWTAPLDARPLAPGEDAATVTAGQLRQMIEVRSWPAISAVFPPVPARRHRRPGR